MFAAIGFALAGTSVLPPVFGRSAVVVAVPFVLAGVAAIFGTRGLIFAVVMSVVRGLWIATAAALAIARGPALATP